MMTIHNMPELQRERLTRVHVLKLLRELTLCDAADKNGMEVEISWFYDNFYKFPPCLKLNQEDLKLITLMNGMRLVL